MVLEVLRAGRRAVAGVVVAQRVLREERTVVLLYLQHKVLVCMRITT